MWRLVFIVALLCWTSEARVSCKDENGGDIDWYILYKPPNGVKFYYITSGGITTHTKDIDHQSSVLAHTLEPYFDTNDNTKDKGYIVYNDQPPKEKPAPAQGPSKPKKPKVQTPVASKAHPKHASKTYGHSKGVLMMDKTTGVWLLHSTPQLPFGKASNNFFPKDKSGKGGGTVKAQTFICVTFKYDEFKKLAQHLRQINAFAFARHIPTDFEKDFPVAAQIVPQEPNLHEDLESDGGQAFRRFVKKLQKTNTNDHEKNAEGGDLYVTIAKTLDSDVFAQTWGCQRGKSPSFTPANKRHVYNVLTVDVNQVKWKRTQDHSKWCVSKDKPWTCFADSNRSFSQYERPGGALCINNPTVADLFRKFIQTIQGPSGDSVAGPGSTGASSAGSSSDDSDCEVDSDSDSDSDSAMDTS